MLTKQEVRQILSLDKRLTDEEINATVDRYISNIYGSTEAYSIIQNGGGKTDG